MSLDGTKPMIEVRGLKKSFNGQEVLRGVDLSIPRGKITVVIGPSGCGKTVLLRHLIGLLKAESGTIIVDGTSIATLSGRAMNDFRRKFGMLFQNAALFDSMTVAENVAFPLIESLRGHKLPDDLKDRVEDKLVHVGLPGIGLKLPSELSGGMRKRVGLARAIMLEPAIILYDEPTTGLDPIMTAAIDNLIMSMQQKLGVTAVVISHDIESTLRIADQIAMLHQGRIIECGEPDRFKRSQNPIVREFLDVGTRYSRGAA